MTRLLPIQLALHNLKQMQLPPRCQCTEEQAVDMLRLLTGQDFGTDTVAWEKWLIQNQPEDIDFGKYD